MQQSRPQTTASLRELALLAALTLSVGLWSFIAPKDRLTWWMEALPVIIALPLLAMTWRSFAFTRLSYWLIVLHAIVLLVGAHYTYAEVPAFNWLRDALGTSRNSYDGVGHFVQGFVPAIIARELIIRTSPLRSGKWLFILVTLGVLGISAIYELIEWFAAISTGGAADAFLGTQGDPWDTQKDMALALVGAMGAQIVLSRLHDRQMGTADGVRFAS